MHYSNEFSSTKSLSLFLATHLNILRVSKRYICQEVFVKSNKIYKDTAGVEYYWFIANLIFWSLAILLFQSNEFSPLFCFVLFCLIPWLRTTSALNIIYHEHRPRWPFLQTTNSFYNASLQKWIWKLFSLIRFVFIRHDLSDWLSTATLVLISKLWFGQWGLQNTCKRTYT